MTDVQTKTLPTEGTLTATVKAAGDKGSGAFEAILSMPTLDRDGEIIDARAFEPLPDHITIDIDHGMSVETTVGSGRPFYEGDVLKFTGTFASTELGQLTRTLVKEEHIRTMSVAYRAAQYVNDDDGVPHLRRAELLNAAIVPIPANREAMIIAAKEMKLGARNSAGDKERIQGAHDLFVELGADCGEKHMVSVAVDGKTVAGTVAVFTTGTETFTNTKDVPDAPPEAEAVAPAPPPLPADVVRALAAAMTAEADLLLTQ